jgi:hypothetical protein
MIYPSILAVDPSNRTCISLTKHVCVSAVYASSCAGGRGNANLVETAFGGECGYVGVIASATWMLKGLCLGQYCLETWLSMATTEDTSNENGARIKTRKPVDPRKHYNIAADYKPGPHSIMRSISTVNHPRRISY